jgi:hypothetical protein
MAQKYDGFRTDAGVQEIPPDARQLIGTTIEFGVAAAQMQVAWCDRTMETLQRLAGR